MERKIRVFDKTPRDEDVRKYSYGKKRIENNIENKCKSFGKGGNYISSNNKTAVESIETLSKHTSTIIIVINNSGGVTETAP